MDIYVIKKVNQNWNCGIQVIDIWVFFFNICVCLKIFIINYGKTLIFLRVYQSELKQKTALRS